MTTTKSRDNVWRQTEITKSRIDVTFFDDKGVLMYHHFKVINPTREKEVVSFGVVYKTGTVRMSETDCPLYYK